ncbi:hypothetical protein [Sphingomonas sp. Leaf62]|nr:hypothetical protein [Sphingomonas sp. Leaf62]
MRQHRFTAPNYILPLKNGSSAAMAIDPLSRTIRVCGRARG